MSVTHLSSTPDGNPLPGDYPDTTPPVGDPVPSSDPTEPSGTPRD